MKQTVQDALGFVGSLQTFDFVELNDTDVIQADDKIVLVADEQIDENSQLFSQFPSKLEILTN